jgi:RNA polymerase sigma factor (sigma-70 family)
MSDSKVSTRLSNDSDSFRPATQRHALWHAFKKGNRHAFAELVECNYPFLLNYGLRLDKDRDFVKDCIHDLFIELWNSKERLEEVRCAKAYLLKSLRRKLLRESQKIRWFREAKEVADDYAFEVQFTIESYLIQNEIQHEDLKKLQFNLDKLTKRQREAMYLRFYQEMEYDEIAGVMSINNHSAVNLIHEALKLLRKNWFLTTTVIFTQLLEC